MPDWVPDWNPPKPINKPVRKFVAAGRDCLWIFPLCPFMVSTHVKPWCYIAEFWPFFFPKNLEIPWNSFLSATRCVHKALGLRKPPFSEPLVVQDMWLSKQQIYMQNISLHTIIIHNLYSIDLPLGVAQFSGLTFLIWNSKSWQCHARWVDVLYFCAKATWLPRFEYHRNGKNWPAFATGKSGELRFWMQCWNVGRHAMSNPGLYCIPKRRRGS